MLCSIIVSCFLRRVHHSLSQLQHSNGNRACLLYCETDFEDALKQGPIVNFNLLRPDGEVLGYHQVEKLASVYDIHLRTGCFCNTGACMRYLGLDSELLQQHLQVRSLRWGRDQSDEGWGEGEVKRKGGDRG